MVENEMVLYTEKEPEVIEECACCGEPIYLGETYMEDIGNYIHEDCFHEYIKNNYTPEELAEELGVKVNAHYI